ncbi:glycosyltransferase [Parafrankia elaeagni]|uniref:glycosyltransferase n=1 Tax=Parafrankia elaeagni TaxID=222534 RepID=UPI00037A3B40|nr:glycosyltransferase [Parafrankia elaeagni]
MNPATGRVLVDCAGAWMGGALRLLSELDAHLARQPTSDVVVVGRNRSLTSTWLIRRERAARYRRIIALNNAGFVATRGERWVLLRNLLHFLPAEEVAQLPGGLPTTIIRQAPIVRACARKADVVVVPTTLMADRVQQALPTLGSRIVVRPHPLSRPPQSDPAVRDRYRFLCPVLFEPFKAMGQRLRNVAEAARKVSDLAEREVTVTVTATDDEARREGLLDCSPLRFVGRLTPQQLVPLQHSHGALLYPTKVESFGYPLAEARLAGIPVVARGTAQSREVAGPVLVPYQHEDPDEIATAMHVALTADPPRESANPFDPDEYFTWLLARG